MQKAVCRYVQSLGEGEVALSQAANFVRQSASACIHNRCMIMMRCSTARFDVSWATRLLYDVQWESHACLNGVCTGSDKHPLSADPERCDATQHTLFPVPSDR